MASKNEIRHRVSLEGDEDVKRRLRAVADAANQSAQDVERRQNAAKAVADRREKFGNVREALAPVTNELGGLGGGLFSGIGGFVTRLAGGLLSPAGLIAGITSAVLAMVKLGDETQRQKSRLDALGDTKGLASVGDQAKRVGADIGGTQLRYERFLAFEQRANANNRAVTHPPGFAPGDVEDAASRVRVVGPSGSSQSPPSRTAFQAFDAALFGQIRRDVRSANEANALASDFQSRLFDQGLTGDALRSLQQAAPHAANFVTGSLTQFLGQGFSNPNQLAARLDSGRARVSANDLIREGALKAPDALKEIESAERVSIAFDKLTASANQLAESFGTSSPRLVKLIDEFAGGIDNMRKQMEENAKGGGAQTLNDVFNGTNGDLLGRFTTYINNHLSDIFNGPKFLQQTPEEFAARFAQGPQASDFPRGQATDPTSRLAFDALAVDPLARARGIEAPLQPQQDATSNADALNAATTSATDSLSSFAAAIKTFLANLFGLSSSSEGKPQTVQAFAIGGPVRMDGGGHISGPGTTTSDSIPAMLSDKEYVIKASSAKKVGRRFLDWVNAGARGFAGGGSAVGSSTGGFLGPGQHDITYDPQSGGAVIDGNLHYPGDPLLDDPIVRQAIEESKQSMSAGQNKRKYKSDFVGVFGGHVFNTPGSYASGGPVGSVPFFGAPRFADGGSVASWSPMSVGDIAPPDIGNLGSGDLPHLGTVDLRTNAGDVRMHASADSVEDLRRAARDSANVQIGRAPSWVYGRGR